MLPRLIDLFYHSLSDNKNFYTFYLKQTFFKIPDCNATVVAIFSDPYNHVMAIIISKDLQNEQILFILSLISQNLSYLNDYVTNSSLIEFEFFEIHYLIL